MRIVLIHVALIAVFGILLPYRRGLDFLDPVTVGAYACMGIIFAPPACAAAFAKDRPQSLREAMRRALKAVAYGEAMAWVMLIGGIATVNFTHGGGPQVPELDSLAETALLGLTGSIALALFAGWLTLHFSPGTARMGMRVIFLSLLWVFFFYSRRLPQVALPAAGLSVLVAGLVFHMLSREVAPA